MAESHHDIPKSMYYPRPTDVAGPLRPSEVPDQAAFKDMDHVPHEARLSLGRTAVELIRERDQHAADLAAAESKMDELRALRPAGFIAKFRQRNALAAWLERHDYSNYAYAQNTLEGRIQGAKARHETATEPLNQEMADLRNIFMDFSDTERRLADALLRHHGLPEEIIAACDETADGSGRRNIIDWLAPPDQQSPETGASTKQLETVLLWNASFTEEIASNTDLVKQTARQYQTRAQKRWSRAVSTLHSQRNHLKSQK